MSATPGKGVSRPDASLSGRLERALAGLARSSATGLSRLDEATKALAKGLDGPAAILQLELEGGRAETLTLRGRSGPLKSISFQLPDRLRRTIVKAAAGKRYFFQAKGLGQDKDVPAAFRRWGARSLRGEIVLDEAGTALACVLAFGEPGRDRAEERHFFRLIAQTIGADYRRILGESGSTRRDVEVRGLVDASALGVIVHRGDRLLYANPAFARILGYRDVEAVLALESLAATVVPEHRDRLAAAVADCARGELIQEGVGYGGLSADGHAIALSGNLQAIEWAGTPAVLTTVTDLSADQAPALLLDSAMADSANFAIIGRRLDGTIFSWNRVAERIFGYTADEVIGQPIAIICPPDDREAWRSVNEAVLNSEGVVSSEFQRLRKDGTIVSLRTSLSPIRDATGKAVGISGISQDISPVRRLESVLERNLLLLQRAQQMGSMGSWTWYAGDRDVTLSVQAREVLGMAPEDPAFTSLDDYVDRFVHPDDRSRMKGLLVSLGPDNAVVNDTHRIVLWDGSTRSIQLWGEASFDSNGDAVSMIGVLQDVTEIDQTRAALVDSEARFRDFVDVASDWIWETDPDGHFRYMSDRISSVTGFSSSYYLGKSWSDCMVQPTNAALGAYESEVAGQREFRDLVFRIETRDGREAWVALSGMPRYESGLYFQGYRGAGRDITARQQFETRLQLAMEAAEKANEVKSRFLAAASHDLRQPLHAMRLLVHSLGASASHADSEVIVGEIARGLRSMTDILNALLDVGELDAGRVKPDVRVFDLGQLFDTVAVAAASRAAEKGIDFRYLMTAARVRSDPALLARIIENFLLNAVQHTYRGRVLMGCRRRGAKLRIEVWDTGPGIPPDKHAAIFEEYHQLDESGGRAERGIGLGLSIVSRFADLLQHPVEVKSVPGQGSCFAVEVPVAESVHQAPRQRAEARQMPLDLSGLVILLIENDVPVRDATERLLVSRGAKVLSANDAEEAMQRLRRRRRPPDLILSDLDLPGEVPGHLAVERIRARFKVTIPAIILTGETRSSRLDAAARSGLPILRKPVSAARIWKAISSQLRLGEAAE